MAAREELTFTVETGIEPPQSTRSTSPLVLALRDMQIGQSVLVPNKTARQVGHYVSVAKARTEKYFQCKTLNVGVRIWRLE